MTNTPDTKRRTGSRFVPALMLAAALLLLGAACGDDSSSGDSASGGDTATTEASGGSAEATTEVDIKDFTFVPAEIKVSAGDTVTWTNSDSSPHTVKDQNDVSDESDDLGEGDTFEITYDEAGEYPYICGIHNYMTGTVIVE